MRRGIDSGPIINALKASTLALSLVLAVDAAAQQVTVTTAGASDGLEAALRDASQILSLKAEGDASSLDMVAAARADYRRLLTALYARGYYSGVISILIDGREAAGIAPLDAPAQIDAIAIAVDPGLRFTFGETQIGPLAPGTQLPEGFATGSIARSETVKEAVAAAITAWQAEGRAKATPASQDLVAIHAQTRLDVRIGIDPGPVLTFGRMAVTGNASVREDRIRAIAGFPDGRQFSPEDVAIVETRLRRTGAFRSATLVEAETISPGDTLDYTLQLVEQKPRRLGYGVEFSSVEGLTLSGYWLHRNFLGGAENFRVDANITGLLSETGGIDYGLTAAFVRPGTLHPETDLFANGDIQHLDEPGYLLDQVGAEVGLLRRFRDNLILSGAIGFTTARVVDGLGTRDYTLLTLPLTGEQDRRDNALDPTTGTYLSLDVTPYLGFGDVQSGGRIAADGRIYRSFGASDGLTLAFRGQVGTVIGPDITKAPADYLFYSGGGGTVRGQDYQSLGVDLGGGVTTGGLSFASASTEIRADVTEKIGLVGFYDVGFVGANSLSFGNGDWHSGAGLGLRYQTGIGPIRIDLATPANGPEAGKSVSFYVGIGQSF